MLQKLALPEDAFWELNEYCRQLGIGFLSTPFDFKSIQFLSSFHMDYWKIPSGEITNLPYLENIARIPQKVILSTGMSEIAEIKAAVDILERRQLVWFQACAVVRTVHGFVQGKMLFDHSGA